MPPGLAGKLDPLCDRFESALKTGADPRLEDFIAQVEQGHRAPLLAELLALELEYRRRRGDTLIAEEYQRRLPEYPEIIGHAFYTVVTVESSSPPQGHSSAGETAAASPLPGFNLPDDPAFRARYELIAEVGRGGMGVVYSARHKKLDRRVAIKITLPDAATDRFRREATLLAKIKSPFVVTVYDFDTLPNGYPMLVMEWVEGTNLRQLIKARGGLLGEDEALRLMLHTCQGMLSAAELGIIHRDLKPTNLLIDAGGTCRIADFGLARGPATGADLSHTGQVMGTPYYMAPEQAEDPRGVDTRADIYSFGATFYHALTGKPPFDGPSAFSILYKHKTEPLISPRARNSALSERTSDLLERCLAKAPAERFSSFEQIIRLLQPSGHPLSARQPSPWTVSGDKELAAYLALYGERRTSYLAEQQRWDEELDAYTFPRGQILRIMRGDLARQSVDAVVSSDTCFLTMDSGVSAALRRAAGEEVADQTRRQAPVRPGRALVTIGGNLPARFVFHGVTVGYVDEELVRPSRDLIAEIMASCFYHADSHQVRSLAFPLLGTGAQGFPRDICLDTMFQFLARMFLRGLTSVRDARIVLYRDDGSL
jgi:serine/threonine protein kinase